MLVFIFTFLVLAFIWLNLSLGLLHWSVTVNIGNWHPFISTIIRIILIIIALIGAILFTILFFICLGNIKLPLK